jgi:predicted AlkP superfamily pyrophosphatase or phosphodiesterase
VISLGTQDRKKIVILEQRRAPKSRRFDTISEPAPMKRIFVFASIIILFSGILESGQRPKLVVFISIDQMKAEYLDWYKSEFTGGFKRILMEGTQYTNADLNYALSETGPGHAALGTGTYPTHSGITENNWYDRRTLNRVYCVEDSTAEKAEAEGGGMSSKNLMVTALGDWLKTASPASKVIAASIKDRAAILMAGQRPDCAFWYDRKLGHMVTSEFYVKEVPAWVRSFNADNWIATHVPAAWTKIAPESVYAKYGPDELEGEMKWGGSTMFPHVFEPDKRNEQIVSSPFGDAMILDFALEAVKAEHLGQRYVPDLLIVSLSCTDYIGHAFGGNSHEMVDQMIRLDRVLGDFIKNVEKIVGQGNILLALSADHAAMPLPEYRKTVQHKDARRIITTTDVNPRIEALDLALQHEFKTTEHIIQSEAFLNYPAAAAAGVDSIALEKRMRDGLLKIDGITDVYFRRELVIGKSRVHDLLGYYQRGYYAPRGRDFIIRPCEFCLLTSSPTGTSHGTPYRYDTHVPILFWGNGVKSQQVTRVVHTVDVAPTLAKAVGANPPSTIDGKSLKEIVK